MKQDNNLYPYLLEECSNLQREAEDYDDALNYLEDIVTDASEKFPNEKYIRERAEDALKEVFGVI